jgi:hypothetical protein
MDVIIACHIYKIQIRKRKALFPTSSLKMTFPSLNLEMKVGVCITCEESNHFPH